MKTTICPFSKTEVEAYMQKAFAYVNNNHPGVKGAEWDNRIKEGLRIDYAKGAGSQPRKNWEDLTDTHDAHMFADLVFEGYYED